eukprot:Ihof_evm1s431 gene=Ihof_evmTU1s431
MSEMQDIPGGYDDVLADLLDFQEKNPILYAPQDQTPNHSLTSSSPLSGTNTSDQFDFGDLEDDWTLSGGSHNQLEMMTLNNLLVGNTGPIGTQIIPKSEVTYSPIALSPPNGMHLDPMRNGNMGHPGLPSSFVMNYYMNQPQISKFPSMPPTFQSNLPTQEQANATIFAAAAAAASAAAAAIPFVQAQSPFPIGLQSANMNYKQSDKVPIQRLSMVSNKKSKWLNESNNKSSHNKIERRYRDKLNGQLVSLRDAIPATNGCPRVNKATVMRKAVEYINYLHTNNARLKRHNDSLCALLNAHGLGQLAAEIMAEMDEEPSDGGETVVKPKRKARKTSLDTPVSKATRVMGVGLMMFCFAYNPLAGMLPLNEEAVSSATVRVLSSFNEPMSVQTLVVIADRVWWALRIILLLIFSLYCILPRLVTLETSPVQWDKATNHSKHATKARSSRKLNQSKHHLEAALLSIGRAVPTENARELGLAVVWQIIRQLSHRLYVGTWIESLILDHSESAVDSRETVADLYQSLQRLALMSALTAKRVNLSNPEFTSNPATAAPKASGLRLLYATLCAVNEADVLAAINASPVLLADIYITTVAVLVALDVSPFLIRLYSCLAANQRKACATAGVSIGADREWAYHSEGMAYLQSGQWLEASRCAAHIGQSQATTPIVLIGHISRTQRVLEGYNALCEGVQTCTELTDLFCSLHNQAVEAHDVSTIGWCAVGTAVCMLRLDNITQARTLLTVIQLPSSVAAEAQSLLYALKAAVYLRDGQPELARESVIASSNALINATGLLVLNPIAASQSLRLKLQCLAADILLGVRMDLSEDKSYNFEEEVSRDMVALGRIAEILPLAQTIILRYQGCFRQLNGGSIRHTQYFLQKAAKTAKRHGQMRDEALALINMAK